MVRARILGVALAPLFIAACASVPSPPPLPSPAASPLPNFSFASDFGACSTTALFAIEFEAAPGELRFNGTAGVANPCHKLTAWPDISRGEVVLRLEKSATAGACVQCLGAIPFQGKVRELEPGVYTVRAVLDGAPQREVTLYVPRVNESAPFCGGIAGIPCPTEHRCVLDGTFPDAGGRCVPLDAA